MSSIKKCLIITYGFFGDIAYASSIAKKLKQESQYDVVDYLIGFQQMQRLLQNNPFIDTVHVSEYPSPQPYNDLLDYSTYDNIVQLSQLSFQSPPCYEFQAKAGVRTPDAEFELFTELEYDQIASSYIQDSFSNGKKTIALMHGWEAKTYVFTREQYEIGIDVPNLGYGGRHRNTEWITQQLAEHFNLLFVGMPIDTSQSQTACIPDHDNRSILFECSLLKFCDAFVGAEGGLCNLAAGVGTRTIITGDFVHQLYGWNGVLRKIDQPKLGPVHYFTGRGHVELDPYLTDSEVASQIIQNISSI